LVTDKNGETGIPVATAAPPGRPARLLGWSAAFAIAGATLVIIIVSAAGPSAAVPALRHPAAGPPW